MTSLITFSAATKCPICGSTHLITAEDGAVVCGHCGTVVVPPELNSFSTVIGHSEDGRPVESGSILNTEVHNPYGSEIGFGKGLKKGVRKAEKRTKFLNSKESVDGDIRDGIIKAYEMLSRISTLHDLPRIPRYVYNEAHELSKTLTKLEWKEIRKHRIENRKMHGFAILLALIDGDPNLPPSELWLNMMAKEMDDNNKKLNLGILMDLKKKVRTVLKDHIRSMEEVEVQKALAVFNYLVRRFDYINDDFRIEHAVEVFSIIYRYAKKKGLTNGRSILSFAGAVSYIVFNILNTSVERRITQEEIAKALGRGVNSIRSAHKLILDNLVILVAIPKKNQKRRTRGRSRRG